MPREPSAEGVDDISTRDCHGSVQNGLRAFDTIVAVARPGVPARLPNDERFAGFEVQGMFTWSDNAVAGYGGGFVREALRPGQIR